MNYVNDCPYLLEGWLYKADDGTVFVQVNPNDLYDKWGFAGGDLVNHLLEVYWEDGKAAWCDFHVWMRLIHKEWSFLCEVLEKCMVPRVTSHKIEICYLPNIHKDAYLKSIDGREAFDNLPRLEPERIYIPLSEIEGVLKAMFEREVKSFDAANP